MKSSRNIYKLNQSELPSEIRHCLTVINRVALEQKINYLVVGATARDLVFEHLFRIGVERATRDLDITIQVETWAVYEQFIEALKDEGFDRHNRVTHRLYFGQTDDSLPIDIVPFGDLSNEQGDIAIPPDEFEMSVLGFAEAYQHVLNIELDANLVVPIASPEGLVLLKLISWIDRGIVRREKDATDLWFLIQNYQRLPWVREPIYDTPHMEKHDFDIEKASAEFLANQIFDIASKTSIEFIHKNLLVDEAMTEALVREMGSNSEHALENRYEIMRIIFIVLFTRHNEAQI